MRWDKEVGRPAEERLQKTEIDDEDDDEVDDEDDKDDDDKGNAIR